MKTHSFVEGLAALNTRGGLVVPVRLNKRMKEILFELITEGRERISVLFKNKGDENNFLEAMMWLEEELTRKKSFKIKLSKKVGQKIFCFIWDNKYHHLSSDPDFEKAIQWVVNKINKKYSQTELHLPEKK